MYFKVSRGTDLFDKLVACFERAAECDSSSFKWIQSIGGTSFRNGWWDIGGGVSSVTFKGAPPRGWTKAGVKYGPNEYLPSSAKMYNDLRSKIEELPHVSFTDLNCILKYDPREGRTPKHILSSWICLA